MGAPNAEKNPKVEINQEVKTCTEKNQEDIKDDFFMVHIMFFILGLANFIPSTFFTTATDYWNYKFRDPYNEDTSSSNRTALQSHFSAACAACSTIPGILALILAKLYLHRIKLKTSILFAFTISILPFAISCAFIYADTDTWQTNFFILTMFLIACMNMVTQVGSLGTFEIMSSFPPSTLGCYIVGQGSSAIFNSILQIISLAIGPSATSSALIYFLTGTLLLIFSLIYYLIAQKTQYYKHYSQKEVTSKHDTFAELYDAFKKVWKLAVMFEFMVIAQCTMHPTITSLVASENEGSGPWADKYFTPVITFLLNGVMESLGRTVGSKFAHMLNGTAIAIFAFFRMIVFIFLIVFCNAQPRYHLSVLFPHDYQYIIIVICFAFTGGFFYTVTFTTIGNYLPPEKLNTGFSAILIFTSVFMGLTSILGYFTVNIL